MNMLHNLERQVLAQGKKHIMNSEDAPDRCEWSVEVNGDPPEPLAPETKLCAWLTLGKDSLTFDDYRFMVIDEAVPLYVEEVEFLRERQDFQPLLLRFQKLGIERELNLHRLNAIIDWPADWPEPEAEDSC